MVRAFAQETAELRHFEQLNRHYIAENLKLVKIQGFFQPLLEALIGIGEFDVVAHEHIMEDGFKRRVDIGFRHKAQPSVTSIYVLAGANVGRSSTLRLLPSSWTSASVKPSLG